MAPATRPLGRGRRARAACAGMTLLEILVVLALMALIAGIALPMLGPGVSNGEMKRAARELAAGMRYARSEAVASRQETFVAIDLEGRRFRVANDPTERRLPSGVELKLFTAQRDIVDERTGAIRFFPDGGSDGGRVTLTAGERKLEVDVDWLTGRVAILGEPDS